MTCQNKLKSFLFVDYTTLVHSNRDFDSLIAEFNTELVNIEKWLIRNRLSLNVGKSVALVISNRISYSSDLSKLRINDFEVSYSDDAKYLGVIIDRSLSFGRHIREISGKISRSVGIMYRLSFYVPKYAMLNLYYTLILYIVI